MHNSSPILLVEDDLVDARTVERALKDLNAANPLNHSIDGEQALEYLRSEGNKKPSIILLDLNLPKMDGLELLKAIKADELLKRIPVVVLTTSKNNEDIVQSLELSAAGYMVKPTDYKGFVEMMRTIVSYWSLSELPDFTVEDGKYKVQSLSS